ncbi:hypothetical protein QZM81_19505 [Burkholderia cepacia]|uniref:hypothetical protein n=1 Tax=Burkholderia cepacia TaxID=292 RepID=UPI0026530E0F|nr:hypothetical protein [Burkholderia cepacia]MDN7857994.1 hypothetical protein [Burkholderia cepacia]
MAYYKTFELVVLALFIIALNVGAVRVTRSMTKPQNGSVAEVTAFAGSGLLIIVLMVLVGAAWCVAAFFVLDTMSSIGVALILGLFNVGWLFKKVVTRNW